MKRLLWSRQHHEGQEHTRQVQDIVIEKHKAGLGYTKISKALNISQSTVKYTIQELKSGITANLPRPGRPPKLTDRTRTALTTAVTKKPMMTLDELQRATAQVGKLYTEQLLVVHCTNLAFMEEWHF